MKTQSTAWRLLLIATLILLGLLGIGLIANPAGNAGGASLFTSSQALTSVCRDPGPRPEELPTTGEPLPFDCGIAEASGEHNLP